MATAQAVATDLALLLLFAAQHSVMARRSVKEWLRSWVPAPLERTTYVLATNACLALLFLLWEPFGGRVWHVDGAAAAVSVVTLRGRLGRSPSRRRSPSTNPS